MRLRRRLLGARRRKFPTDMMGLRVHQIDLGEGRQMHLFAILLQWLLSLFGQRAAARDWAAWAQRVQPDLRTRSAAMHSAPQRAGDSGRMSVESIYEGRSAPPGWSGGVSAYFERIRQRGS
jgi:hypothetical protein